MRPRNGLLALSMLHLCCVWAVGDWAHLDWAWSLSPCPPTYSSNSGAPHGPPGILLASHSSMLSLAGDSSTCLSWWERDTTLSEAGWKASWSYALFAA